MTVTPISFALVGPGRAGGALLDALEGTNWTCHHIYRRADEVAGAAAGVDAVILAVPDDVIAPVAGAIEPVATTVIMHLSGAKTLDILRPHTRRASVHPLMSLPDRETGATRLVDNAAFAVAGDRLARSLVETLGGRPFDVADRDRVLYHATAAVAANHLVALCAQVERLAARLGLPFDLYRDLMVATLDNVGRVGAVPALTGPAARGDRHTVQAHIEELSRLDRREADLYRIWSTEASRLAGSDTDTDTNTNTTTTTTDGRQAEQHEESWRR